MGPKKGNYQICVSLCAYACDEGALASVMLMLMHVLISYNKS